MEIVVSCDFENEELLGFVSVIQELQSTADSVNVAIKNQYLKEKMKPSIFIGIVILKRIVECINSIKVLSLLGMERDASILLLNLIELRLDIMYISLDEKHANEWLNHEKEHEKPWKVSYLIKTLYLDQNERESQFDNYKKFSMAKHGNPVGGLHSFPIEISKRRLIFKGKENVKDRIAIYLFACAIECIKICRTVIEIATKYKFELSELEQQINFLDEQINKLNYIHVKEMLFELMINISKPEICNYCSFVPKGKIEITCVLRQADWETNNQNEEFKCENLRTL